MFKKLLEEIERLKEEGAAIPIETDEEGIMIKNAQILVASLILKFIKMIGKA